MNRKVKILIVLTFLFLIVVVGSYSYSKYRSEITGSASAELAKWNITVNGCNIVTPDESDSSCFESKVDEGTGTVTIIKNFNHTEFSYDSGGNNNVVDNKIAPGSTGQFIIRIKPNDTEVSIKYTITSSINDDDSSLKYYIKGPSDSERIPMPTDGYVGYINYDEGNTSYEEVITFYVDWENNEDNNEEDTFIGTKSADPKLDIPVQIAFEQYNG